MSVSSAFRIVPFRLYFVIGVPRFIHAILRCFSFAVVVEQFTLTIGQLVPCIVIFLFFFWFEKLFLLMEVFLV